MAFAILDTGVYIDHWERSFYADELARLRQRFIVRHSSVVLSELRRGAHTKKAIGLVEALRRIAPMVWAPTADDWWRAGDLVRQIGDAQDWEINKRREFQNDVLIALTAVHHGAHVVTTNSADFELLEQTMGVHVVPLPASR